MRYAFIIPFFLLSVTLFSVLGQTEVLHSERPNSVNPIPYQLIASSRNSTQLSSLPDTIGLKEPLDSTAPVSKPINLVGISGELLSPIGSTNWLGPMDMCVLDSHLYVVANLGILVWDVRNPNAPLFIRQYEWPTAIPAINFTIRGENGFLYLLTPYEGLKVIDASNPADLRIRSSLHLPVQLNFMEIWDGMLYIPSAYDYLFIIDVSNPDSLVIVNQFRSDDISFDLTMGMALYAPDPTPLLYFSIGYGNSPLFTYSMEDPVHPQLWNVYWGPGAGLPPFYGQLLCVGDMLLSYLPGGSQYRVMSLWDPNIPHYACSVSVGVNITDLAVEGNRMYISTNSGIRTFDISSLCSPILIGVALLPGFKDGYSGDMVVDGMWVYNHGSDGLSRERIAVSDMSAPSNPLTRELYSSREAEALRISKSLPVMCASTWLRMISDRAFDLHNPFLPQQGADFGPGNNAEHTTGADFDGMYMYVSSNDASSPPRRAGIARFDMTNPNAPVRWSQLVFGTNADDSHISFEDVAARDNYAYVAAEDSGLFVFFYHQQNANPTIKARLSLPPQARSIAIRGNRAYVVCWGHDRTGGLYDGAYLVVVDISEPTNPTIIGFQEPWGHYNVEIAGNVLATTSWMIDHWAISIYEIDASGWPILVSTYDPPDRTGSLILLELTTTHMYVDNGNALDLVDISDPSSPFLAERKYSIGQVYDVAAKGDAVYIGQEFGIEVCRGPACCVGTTGNVDGQADVDLADLSSLINYFQSEGNMVCTGEADLNGSGVIDISDISYMIGYLTGEGIRELPDCP